MGVVFAYAAFAFKFILSFTSVGDFSRHDLLIDALQSEPARKEFFICSSAPDTIVVYDQARFCLNCDDTMICEGRSLMFIEEEPTDLNNEKYLQVYRADVEKKKIALYISRPYSGAAVVFTYKRTANRFKLKSWVIGTF